MSLLIGLEGDWNRNVKSMHIATDVRTVHVNDAWAGRKLVV